MQSAFDREGIISRDVIDILSMAQRFKKSWFWHTRIPASIPAFWVTSRPYFFVQRRNEGFILLRMTFAASVISKFFHPATLSLQAMS